MDISFKIGKGTFGKIFSRRSAGSEIDKATRRVLLGWDGDKNDIAISEESSLSLAGVWRCVSLISESVSMLPLHVYRRAASGREPDYDHPVYRLVKHPTQYSNKADFFQLLLTHLLLWGNSYALIIRDKYYRPVRFKGYHPSEVRPVLNRDTEEVWYDMGGEIHPARDVIHLRGLSVDGIEGKSPIAVHRDNLKLSAYAQKYGEQFFAKGGNMSGVFEVPAELSDQAYDRLVNGLAERMAGIRNAHKPLVLEGSMKYTRISIPPEDAQFIATRKFQKNEIATIFGVPPHMIADLDRATNNNIEQQSMEYVIYCLMPYLVRIEEEFDRKLLREDEFGKVFVKFSLNALMRGDTKTRSEYYRNMSQIGAMSPNEIRALEELNEYPDGDLYLVQMNMQTVAAAKQANTNRDGKKE